MAEYIRMAEYTLRTNYSCADFEGDKGQTVEVSDKVAAKYPDAFVETAKETPAKDVAAKYPDAFVETAKETPAKDPDAAPATSRRSRGRANK